MGLPIDQLICASNSNNVLTEFLREGVYDRNRQFYNTMSPSMDILISSNLERRTASTMWSFSTTRVKRTALSRRPASGAGAWTCSEGAGRAMCTS